MICPCCGRYLRVNQSSAERRARWALKILAIEGNDEVTIDISLALAKHWPEVRLVAAHMGHNGLELARREPPDMVIVDLGLPDIHGLEVIKSIRLLSKIPIFVLAVKGGLQFCW